MKRISFTGNIVILGCGSVSRCLQPLLLRHLDIDFFKLIIIDKKNCANLIPVTLKIGARFIQQEINNENLEILNQYLKPGDILIDLTTSTDTISLIDWCQKNNILFLNTSLEWPTKKNELKVINAKNTLYYYHVKLQEKSKQWPLNGATAVIDHGANPGLVSHWVKLALEDISKNILETNKDQVRNNQIEKALSENNFAQLSMLTGTKVIHISERDTQITNDPKKVNEFVNTWSAVGLYEESILPAELGWGTHEKTLPQNAIEHTIGNKNQIFLNQYGVNTFIESWVPGGNIIGMLISHAESYSISDHLTVLSSKDFEIKDNLSNNVLYRPTVYFVYLTSDSAFVSLHESKMQNYDLQPNLRIINDDIIDGHDQVGVLLLGHDLNGWWTGSTLDIHQTRELVGYGQNPTTLQVAASMLGALFWMIKNPNKGLCMPDDLPYKEILEIANPYLGTISSIQTDWKPKKDKNNQWQFADFISE